MVNAPHQFVLTYAAVHADETPIALLAPGKWTTHRVHVWM